MQGNLLFETGFIHDVAFFCQHLSVVMSSFLIYSIHYVYSIPGVEMAPLGSWTSAPKDTFIVGLKELPETDDPVTHRHIFYAHAYKVLKKCAAISCNRFWQDDPTLESC